MDDHNPEHTKTLARGMADHVQALNHATAHPDGLVYPAHAYDVIGQLYVILGRLPQTIEQLSDYLTLAISQREATTGHTEQDQAVATTYAQHMDDTAQHLGMALRSLGRAHSAIADVSSTHSAIADVNHAHPQS